MRGQKNEKLHQIETGLKKAGLQLVDDTNVQMNLNERMTHHKVPSVSIAVIDENELKLTSAYAAAPETIYQAGSVSKPVAALVALLVAKKYGLDLDEDVNQILARAKSTYKLPESEFTTTEKVTLRTLLSHTAGLKVHGFDGYASDTKELPTTQQILEGKKSTSPTNSKPVESFAAPGTEFRYSGGGTTLMQLILEEVTKEEFLGEREKFPAIARKYVLDPLEMKSSGFEIHRPGEENFHPTVAYDREGNPIKGDWNLYPESAAAGLWSTPADLARFMIEIQKAYNGQSSKIPQQIAKEMLTKQGPGNYGLGPEIDIYDNSLSFSHGGSNNGFRCFFRGFANGKGAVIMANSDNGVSLIDEIIPSIAAAYAWPAHDYTNAKVKRPEIIDTAIYENYKGKYLVEKTIPFEFYTRENKFYVLIPFPQPGDSLKEFELIPESKTNFFHISDKARLEFVFPSGEGKAETFTCSLTPDPGEREKTELKVTPSIGSESTQAQLSSTSRVALVMPMDIKDESTDTMVATSEQSPASQSIVQASDKSSIKDVEMSSEEAVNKDHANKRKSNDSVSPQNPKKK